MSSSVASPAASFSPQPSSMPPMPNSNGPSGQAMLFGILAVFVSVFAVFAIGGGLWHHYRRRGPQNGIVLEYDEAAGEYRGVPKLWEVWAEDVHEKHEKSCPWDGLQPLAIEIYPAPNGTSPGETQPRHDWLPHIRRYTSSSSSTSDEQSVDEKSVVKNPSDGEGEAGAAQVSFIIAMPYPGCSTRAPQRDVRWSGATLRRPDWICGEYVIGTHHAPFRENEA
ncbi:hypothetical protein FA95DRAFT_178779 [Auriscalpium vulgare]|uniref:Uncharacterized protein n=1 Tax=Auriscalpium vulgare TaxID=40419 RepID=A0ACB8RM79_9AGAM|nr:hypothetical protein FA95DRAFT_178779 [Auriscalpium vulgare]